VSTAGPEAAPGLVRQALVRYVLASGAILLAVCFAMVALSVLLARQEAMSDAERGARAITDAIVTPLADDSIRAPGSEALVRLDRAIQARVQDGSIVRVKLWEPVGPTSGRILYSDDSRVVGRTYELEPEEYVLFGTTGTRTEISALEKAENQFERDADSLVEVYAGLLDASGRPLIFEAYFPTARVAEDAAAIARSVLPITVGGLLVLELATLPLAFLLARRIARLEGERRVALLKAQDASDDERRRIAQDLHDGVVQDLAGVGMALDTVGRQLARTGSPETTTSTVQRVGDIVRRDVLTLRTLITDIYPADIGDEHLVAAIREVPPQLDLRDAVVSIDAPDQLVVSEATATVAYRVVRESLRNVAKHAEAQHVEVIIARTGDELTVVVRDDGAGFEPTSVGRSGHFGLRVLQDAVTEAGGTLSVSSQPGAGATVEAHLPA
jgi:signal transduction histidine kinase